MVLSSAMLAERSWHLSARNAAPAMPIRPEKIRCSAWEKIMNDIDLKNAVREKYSQAALRVRPAGGSCCGATSARSLSNPITSNLYDTSQSGAVPEEAMLASLGCGNPTALAQLKPGEVVLDLGSGGTSVRLIVEQIHLVGRRRERRIGRAIEKRLS